MIDTIKAWLNGTRNYTVGVEIFALVSNDEPLIKVFRTGETLNSKYRLHEELKKIHSELKKQKNGNTNVSRSTTANKKRSSEFKKQEHVPGEYPGQNTASAKPDITDTEISNPELYEACKLEADNIYKECMNKRAVLFSMVPADIYGDPNRPDLVLQRSALAVEVMRLYHKASALYDKVNYVKLHGRLPGADTETDQDTDYNTIPDTKVKPTLDNLRKNYNKIKKREQTSERIALLQKHADNIKILEQRWLLLK